ncbi:MAG: hypothetical protein E7391_02975 [Ruminococcaceae bacterium]|nr:hypothetical protein [Oscillospiraceae bacterium]
MRIFKKLTSIVLIVAFVFSLMPLAVFAEEKTDVATDETTTQPTSIFADVDENTQYKDAIEELYNKKIVDGYLDENGVRTFKPDATITRGEFAKLLAVSLPSKITLDMNVKSSGFSDIDSDASVAWTIPYVKAAFNASVVNGYEDGSFRAKNPVTYAEAVKMVVCAMGYADKVEITDPWYTGYITISDQLKIRMYAMGNGDFNAPASRGLVAQLISNMASSKYIIGTVVPGINDNTAGNGNGSNVIDPSDEEEIDEVSGMMIGAFDETLTGDTLDLSRTQVMIDDEVYEIGTSKTIDEMKELVGYTVDVEYENVRSKRVIKKISKGDALDIKIEDTDIIDVDSLTLIYEDDSKERKIKFTTNTYIFYNGSATGTLTSNEIEDLLLGIENGYVEIIDNDSNKTADVARIYNYETFFVGAKDSSSNTVTDMYTGEKIVLGEAGEDESENVEIQLCDNSGKLSKAYFSTISKNSVLSVARPYVETPDSVTKVIISKRTVKGDVTRKGEDYYTIAGKQYKYTSYYEQLVSINPDKKINAGDTGTYYLDYTGKIVSTALSDTLRYGYIVDAETEDTSSAEPIIRMVTSTSNKITDFTLKDRVSVNGESMTKKKVIEFLEESASAINDGSGKYDAGYADAATYSQPIIFETTSSTGTVISSIKTVAPIGEDDSNALEYDLGKTLDGEKLTFYTSGYTFKDSSNTRRFSMTFASTSDYRAKIFVVPTDRSEEDEYEVYTSASYFKNGYKYVVDAFNVDPTNRYGNIIVVYGGSQVKIDGSNKACIITNIGSEYDEKTMETYKTLSYMEVGVKDPQVNTVIVEDASLLTGLTNGDIIKIATKNDLGKEATLIEKVFVNDKLYEPFDENLDQDVSTDYTFVEKYGTDSDYFNAIVGRVYYSDETAIQLIKCYDIPYEEDDPEVNEIYESAVPYTVSGTATYVMVVDSSKLTTVDDVGNNEGIKYYLYNSVTPNAITANGLGLEDFVYIQRSGTGRITGIVIYR